MIQFPNRIHHTDSPFSPFRFDVYLSTIPTRHPVGRHRTAKQKQLFVVRQRNAREPVERGDVPPGLAVDGNCFVCSRVVACLLPCWAQCPSLGLLSARRGAVAVFSVKNRKSTCAGPGSVPCLSVLTPKCLQSGKIVEIVPWPRAEKCEVPSVQLGGPSVRPIRSRSSAFRPIGRVDR